jgi:hypothetical protein
VVKLEDLKPGDRLVALDSATGYFTKGNIYVFLRPFGIRNYITCTDDTGKSSSWSLIHFERPKGPW